MRFEFFEDEIGQWRWRLWGGSRIVASSGESFDSRSNALRAARTVKEKAGSATLEEEIDLFDALIRRVAQKQRRKKLRLPN